MARRRQETDDDITEADDTAGAATFGGAPTRGTRQVKVKDAGDLLLLRDWLFEELGPPYHLQPPLPSLL